MSRSILLQLARDSIIEVFEAKHIIDKKSLLELHPLLTQNIPTTLNIYLKNQLKASYTNNESSLLDSIVLCAKRAAFEDKESDTLTSTEYLRCEIELVLKTQDGVISERDPAILKN